MTKSTLSILCRVASSNLKGIFYEGLADTGFPCLTIMDGVPGLFQSVCLSVVAPAHNVESAGTEKLAVVSELKPSLIQP